jgi:hypothetical protein
METSSEPDIGALFDHYFAHGCPCRFPRFRAAVARDLREVGAPNWGLSDIRRLLAVFDRRVRLLEKIRVDFDTRGRCETCGAEVIRFSAPVFRDSSLEGAHITPGPLPDVGAAVTWPLPIYGHVYNASGDNVTRAEEERLDRAYPRLAAADWFAYMAELAE